MSTIRGRLDKLRSDMLTKGEVALEKPEIVMAGRCLVRFVMGIVLSGAYIFGSYAPFGVAAVAVSGSGMEGMFALAGAIGGYLVRMGLIDGLKYISACVLVYAAAFVFHDIKSYSRDWFMPCIAAFMSICTGFVYASDAGWTIGATVFFITEAILIGGCSYFYKIALGYRGMADSEGQERKTVVSLLILAATCLISFSGLTIFGGISIGRLAAQIIVMVISYKLSMGIGCAAGVSMGLAMDACSGLGVPFYSMAYGFSGLLAGVFNRHSKFLFTISFILANCVSVLWTWNSVLQISILYETFIVSVIFMLLPASLMDNIYTGQGAGGGYYGAVKIREYTKDRVEKLSGAFRQLYVASREAGLKPGNDGDVATIFDRAADTCCRDCSMRGSCWTVDFESTLDAMNTATAPMMERGSLKMQDLPTYFIQKCKNIDSFIPAVNSELRGLLYRRQFQSRLDDSRAVLLEQYADMSSILKGVASELSTELTFQPYAERRLKRYLKAVGVQAEAAVYKDRNERLHIQISGENLRGLTSDKEYLDKMSALMETRLCQREKESDTEISLMQAEPLAAAVGIASVRKKGEVVSGDRGTYFKTDGGILYVMLSDGMGSGSGAAKESESAVNILQGFLTAGMDPVAALKLLNAAMTVKNDMSAGYATVDLMGINLFTGVSKIYKCGAAPSYVKKGKAVRTFKGESLAAGLEEDGALVPDETNVRLEPGHFAVIASDGVSMQGDDKWLRTMVSQYRGSQAKELARLIVEKAIELYGCEDDMTVLTVFLEERS